jgi:hypothetical protein
MSELMGAITGLPPIPPNFGHGYDFGRANWRMLGNGPDDTVFPGFQGCGDCEVAGSGHETMEAARNAGRPIPQFSGKTIVAQYSTLSGYNVRTGANDSGLNTQDVLAWRQLTGIHDDASHVYKIGKTVALTPGDLHQLWAAAYLFECVGIGFTFQSAQMDQFNAGVAWDYVPGSAIEGGHYVPVMGNNGLVSWGERVGFTQAFYTHLCDEAYCHIDPERYSLVTGQTLEHYTDADLERYIVLVAQLKASA